MARYNEILVGRYNRFVQKLFGMKGDANVPQLAGDIAIAMTLFNGVENRYLEGWDRFASSAAQAGVAATFSEVEIRNPAGSNVIAVFEKITYGNISGFTDSALLLHGPSVATDLATVFTATNPRIDPRGRPNTTLIQSRGNPAAIQGNTIFQCPVANFTTYDFIGTDIVEIQLLPGDALFISSNTVNQSMVASYLWRERFLEESERT
jgi:hypothetical protein